MKPGARKKGGAPPAAETDRDFLILQPELKTGAGDRGRPVAPASDAAVDRLLSAFPGVPVGNKLVDRTVDLTRDALTFGALALRIDPSEDPEDDAAEPASLMTDVGRMADILCRERGGVWGLLNASVFGCCFPETDEAECLKLAARLQAAAAEKFGRTLTAGVAVYPTFHYKKDEILENAGKALHHAGFLGPGGRAAFDSTTLNISGDDYYQRGDIAAAVHEFRAALILNPENANVHISLGVCYGILGRNAEALEAFETAAGLDETDVMPVYNAGLVRLAAGETAEAMACFQKAEAMDPEFFEAAFQLGNLYLEQGAYEDAERFLEKAVRLNPKSGPAFRKLADCLDASGRADAAIQAYKSAVKLNPYDAEALSALGNLFDLKGENPEISTVFCRHSVEIAPENGLFRERLGRLYLKQNLLEEALAEFMRAEELGCDAARFIQEIENMKTARAS